ncbi:DUF2157 domain-containing protein [Candidatus Dependentiae bacterium]|nr:DUF2157 domain-containing protein [Candidatus Dependentiae bacterium]
MFFNKQNFIKSKINEWEINGFLSTEQVSRILEFENNISPKFKFKALTLLSVLGGLFVALGIILVISFNWEEIPRFYKIAGFLIIIAGSCELSLFFSEKNIILKKTFETIWFFLPLAGIGLYGQIYQLSGDSFKPMIVWLILTLPFVYLSKNKPLIFLHTAGLIISVFVGSFEKYSIISLNYRMDFHYGRVWNGSVSEFFKNYFGSICIIFVLWLNIFYQGIKFLSPQIRKKILIFLIIYLWMLGAVTYGSIFASFSMESLFFLSSVLLIFYTSVNPIYCHEENENVYISNYIFLNAVLYAFTFLWNIRYHGNDKIEILHISFIYRIILLLAGIIILYISDKYNDYQKEKNNKILRCLLFMPVLLSLILYMKPNLKIIALVANFLFLFVCFRLMYEGVNKGNHNQINTGVLFIGIIMLTRFIDYFGTLLDSGIAFIIIGILFIIAAYFMNRGRQFLISKMQKK